MDSTRPVVANGRPPVAAISRPCFVCLFFVYLLRVYLYLTAALISPLAHSLAMITIRKASSILDSSHSHGSRADRIE